MTSAFKMTGQKELSAFFLAMPQKLQRGSMRAGATAAAAVFRDEARLRVPKKTGKLAKGIKSGGSRVNPDGSVSARVKLEGPHAFLGIMFEFGVAPHLIGAGKNGEGITLKIGSNLFEGPIEHPGIAPHPFMRPAFDVAKGRAYQAFYDKVQANLAKRTGLTLPTVTVTEEDY